MAKKRTTVLPRIQRELARYGIFTGEFHPDTADPQPEVKLATVIQRILLSLRGEKDPALVTIIRKQIQRAEAGDTKAASFLFDRAFGMPRQTIENLGNNVTKIEIEIVNTKEDGTGKDNSDLHS